jgi:hypothetical protein
MSPKGGFPTGFKGPAGNRAAMLRAYGVYLAEPGNTPLVSDTKKDLRWKSEVAFVLSLLGLFFAIYLSFTGLPPLKAAHGRFWIMSTVLLVSVLSCAVGALDRHLMHARGAARVVLAALASAVAAGPHSRVVGSRGSRSDHRPRCGLADDGGGRDGGGEVPGERSERDTKVRPPSRNGMGNGCTRCRPAILEAETAPPTHIAATGHAQVA